MKDDKLVQNVMACSVFLKPDVARMKKDFLSLSSDKEVSDVIYENNFKKAVDDNLLDIIVKYHPHYNTMVTTQIMEG